MLPKIDAEFAAVIPPLTSDELENLEASIVAEGCRDALLVWKEQSILLDGHNRLGICQKHGVKFETREISLPDRIDAEIWIRKNQAGRRNLTDDQRAMNALGLAEAESKKAMRDRGKAGRAAGGRATPEQEKERLLATASDKRKPTDTRKAAAKSAGVSERKLKQAKQVKKANPALAQKVLTGEVGLKAAVKQVRQAEKAAVKAAIPDNLPAVTDRYRVYVQDIRKDGCGVESNSIDWIITDPPYPEEYLPLYGDLHRFACHALKPGGGMIVMVGQSYLPQILTKMTGGNVVYQWMLSYLTPGGQAVQLWDRKVNTFWKPLIWFVKGKYKGEWIGDVCRSNVNDNDKTHHEWGQSESGMSDIMDRFTFPGQTICDPFVGGGATAVVAVAMNRLLVGFDLDPDAVKTTLHRLSTVQP